MIYIKPAEPDTGFDTPSDPTVTHHECCIPFQTPRQRQKEHSDALCCLVLCCPVKALACSTWLSKPSLSFLCSHVSVFHYACSSLHLAANTRGGIFTRRNGAMPVTSKKMASPPWQHHRDLCGSAPLKHCRTAKGKTHMRRLYDNRRFSVCL